MPERNSEKNTLSSGKARILLSLVFLLVLAFLIAMVQNSISRTTNLLDAQALVHHTNLVLHELDGAEDSLQDAREAALHYILTPEKEDLGDHDNAVAQTWVHLDRISVLTRDDKGYPERMEQLNGYIKDEFRQQGNLMRTNKTLLLYHSPAIDANRERVRAAMQKLKNDEEEALRVQNEAVLARAHDMELSVSLLISGFSGLVAVLFLVVIRALKKLRMAGPNSGGSSQQLQPQSAAAATAGGGQGNS